MARLTTQHEALLGKICDKGALDDAIQAELKTAVGQFTETYA